MNFGQILFGSSLIFVSLIMVLYFVLKTVILEENPGAQKAAANLNLNLNKEPSDTQTVKKTNSKYRYAKKSFFSNPFYKGKHYRKKDSSTFRWD